MEIDEFLKMVLEVENIFNKYGYSIAHIGPSAHEDGEFPLKLLLRKKSCKTCKYYDNEGLFPCGGCVDKNMWERRD